MIAPHSGCVLSQSGKSPGKIKQIVPRDYSTMPIDLAQAFKKELPAIVSNAHIQEVMTLS
jgi:hypothetical protein